MIPKYSNEDIGIQRFSSVVVFKPIKKEYHQGLERYQKVFLMLT